MSVIGVKGVPFKWSLVEMVKTLSRAIAGPFEPLNFVSGKKGFKTCYIRLSERLDPVRVIEKINSSTFGKGAKSVRLIAFIPENVPDLPLAKKNKIPKKIFQKLNIPQMQRPHEVITRTHYEVFVELQSKYPGLYNLSRKTGHKLLEEIARIIGDRLKQIMETNLETRESCFQLSSAYRKSFPHFGDFQLILSTLHRLQDAAGAPRAQIVEAELSAFTSPSLVIDKVPSEKVKEVCNKYIQKITQSVTAHVQRLDAEVRGGEADDDIARKKVREEMKKMLPFIPMIIRQVVSKHFIPKEQPYHRIRLYGEPFLPSREATAPFVRRYNNNVSRVMRSRHMYNLLQFKVPPNQFAALKAMDATVINGAKLVIRSDMPLYEASRELRGELAGYFGGSADDCAMSADDDEDDEEHAEGQE